MTPARRKAYNDYQRWYQTKKRAEKRLALTGIAAPRRRTIHPALLGLSTWMSNQRTNWKTRLDYMELRIGEVRETAELSRERLIQEADFEHRR
jgi:hypothetical protein